jgi:hypothetical protein
MKSILGKITSALAVGAILAVVTTPARAQLNVFYQFNGAGNWSISGVGSNNTPVGTLLADVPTGSTVQAAYLFSSQYGGSPFTPDVSLGGTDYSGGAWTYQGINNSYEDSYVANVTAQMKSAIGGGSATPFQFVVNENVNNSLTDGEALVIVYSNPSDPTATIALLGGVAQSSGSTTTVNYSSPLSGVGSPGFSALMSIGDGYSYQATGVGGLEQQSTITVDGRTLTESAGGQDDGQAQNGALITVGGIGNGSGGPADDPDGFNPDPTIGPSSNAPLGDRTDQEYYQLGAGNDVDSTPFLANGQTSTTITTYNSSHDDLIFFLGLNITAEGAVNAPPPPPTTPDTASTVGLLGLGIGALLTFRRKLGLA